jgi:chloramphenicol-sensitive protein RarD
MYPDSHHKTDWLAGGGAALGAYFLWGISSLYWHLLASVPPVELLAYRVLLSCAVLILVLAATGTLATTFRAAGLTRNLLIYSASALSIATNWSVFMWSAVHGHVIETGIGYLIAPLINVAFGALILGERLTATKGAAVALMTLGLAYLIFNSKELTVWIYFAIGTSFGTYSLFRKLGSLGAVEGLAVETALLTILVAIAFLFGAVSLAYPLTSSSGQAGILALCGIVSLVPLWLFSIANRTLRLATLGFFQYALPTTQFALAIFYYHQFPRTSTIVSVAVIWIALGIVIAEVVVAQKKRAVPRTEHGRVDARPG